MGTRKHYEEDFKEQAAHYPSRSPVQSVYDRGSFLEAVQYPFFKLASAVSMQ